MGNPTACYKFVLKEMIRMSTHTNPYRCMETLKNKSIEELEELVNKHLKDKKLLKAFYAGFATSEFFSQCCNDEANAFPLNDIYDFCGIEDNEEEE